MRSLKPDHTANAEIEAALDAVGMADDQTIALGEAALLFARLDQPQADPEFYRQHLAELGAAVWREAPTTVAEAATALQKVMADRHNYEGDQVTYDHPDNANLCRVIDRRKGLPVALGILYAEAGRRAGWRVDGLSFPAHFLIRVARKGEQVILDPFNGGKILDRSELTQLVKKLLGPERDLEPPFIEPVPNRAILLRLQNNLKARAFAEGEIGRGVILLRNMLRIAPEDGGLWLEYAQGRFTLGELHGARAALDACLEHSLDGYVTIEAEKLLARLRRQLN